MKKALLIMFVLCCCAKLFAQAPFNTMDSVDINNIVATALVHGDMWWNPATGLPACEFPKGTRKGVNFASAVWMSGYDGSGNLHIAAQSYRQDGNDYWPGPLDAGDTLTYATSSNWAKIWKVNLTDIQTFLSLSAHTTANTPQSILTWPGKGNTYATGNGGVALTVTTDIAPFADLNGNGIYEPLLGEYPAIKGGQALWWVFSDNGPAHTQTNGRPLGVEVHAMAYAYSRGTLIDNVVYYDYTILNKSPNNYSTFRWSLFDHFILGYPYADYFGFDSSWRMGICYAGNNPPCGASGPINSYNCNIPLAAVTLVALPGDAGADYVPAGSFIYFNNDNSIIGNPVGDTEYNNYMRARLRNGQHFTNDFSGHGRASRCYGSGPDCNYIYTGTGAPSDTTQWSECNCGNHTGDTRVVLSSSDFTLNAGSSEHVVMAFLVIDTTVGGCGLVNFDSIKILADTAWGNYHREAAAVKNITENNGFSIYPNPAHDKLIIENAGYNNGEESIVIYNTLGQQVNMPMNKNGAKWEVGISRLPEGLYNVLYRNGIVQKTAKFIKE